MSLQIITNNIPRPTLNWWELTEREQNEMDLLPEDYRDGEVFFRYKGNVYPISDFMRIGNNPDFKGWEGYSADTYFSGVIVKFTEDCDSVIVGTYYS
jgi:hypothetical protein